MKVNLFLLAAIIFLSCNDRISIVLKLSQDYPSFQPVEVILNLPQESGGHFLVSLPNTAKSLPLQKTDENTWTFVTPHPLTKGSKLEITHSTTIPSTPCTITQNEEFISARIDTQEILQYAIATQFPADSLPSYYKRSGFIHPLKTLKGRVLTADFPRGHVHQHGIFHAWTRTHVKDSIIDFWNQQARLGDIRHKSVLSIQNGPVFSSFSVVLEYLAFMRGDTAIVAEENWNIRIFPLPEYYLVDWHLQQKCLGPDSIVIDEYHYGGAAFRGTDLWNVEGGAYDSLVYIQTSEGMSHLDGNHSRPEWVTMYGSIQGDYAGIAMLQYPGNFRYPQPIRIHPTMPYFCFAPMVLGKFILHPGDQYEAKYRIMVFDGNPDPNVIRNISSNLKHKPKSE